MKIVINAINLASAGGLNVAHNFLKHLSRCIDSDDSVIVFSPPSKGYQAFNSKSITIIEFPKKYENMIGRLILDNFWLPRKIRALSPDVIFSMGNFAVPIKIKNCPQALLFHWSYATYPDATEVWRRIKKKDKINRKARISLFKSRIRFADLVFPQTKVAENTLRKYYPFDYHTIVIPNAYTTITVDHSNSIDFDTNLLNTETTKLLYLSRHYPHKNIEILIEVAKVFKSRNLPFKIFLTLDPKQSTNTKKLLSLIDLYKLDKQIVNIGSVDHKSVPELYKYVDGVVFPTLLESFSALYVDAMIFEKVMFTSDRDFAHDICGENAFYFDPLSTDSIVNCIVNAYEKPQLIKEKIEIGRKRVKSIPSWPEVTKMYVEGLKSLKIHSASKK